jgi:hypothetical protein
MHVVGISLRRIAEGLSLNIDSLPSDLLAQELVLADTPRRIRPTR